MLIDADWGSSPQAWGSVFFQEPGIERIKSTSVLDSACALSKWNLWEKVTWCSSPREDSELMDVTLIVLTWNCQRISHFFGGYFIAFGFSICGMHPKILQVYWVTCGMHPIIYVIYIYNIYIYCTYIHILYARVSLYTDIPSNDIYICIYIHMEYASWMYLDIHT